MVQQSLAQRARHVYAFAIVTGALTGAAVAGFDRLVRNGLFDHLLDGPLWLQALAPAVGLTVAAAALHWLGHDATPSTSDEYIKDFHDPEHRLDVAAAPARVVASAATLGAGGAMGFEGPSIYMGAAIGSWLQHRFSRFFTRTDSKVLLACGAAAGVAAIFKAPATGLVFAIEVPYRQDIARRVMLPAMFASAASYVVFVAINGTKPLFPIAGAPPFDLRDLGGAALIGLVCGGCARAFSWALTVAKSAAARVSPLVRIPVAGALLAALFAAGRIATGESLVIGSGYQAIDWALEPRHGVMVIVVVFLLRAAATTATLGGGGVGGLFVPLVVQGAVLGSAVSSAVGASDTTLFPLLGVAAFLGAGYRVPLAAVVFVAESTGRPGFVVPGLLAAACSQVLMGRQSVSAYQQDTRVGLLERRLALPVAAALRTDAATVPSDATVAEVLRHQVGELRLRSFPVVDDGAAYHGMVLLEDLAAVPPERWSTTSAIEVARADWPTGDVAWTLADAVAAMEAADLDRLPIIDDDRFVGVVTTGEILKLDSILDTAEDRGMPTDAGPLAAAMRKARATARRSASRRSPS